MLLIAPRSPEVVERLRAEIQQKVESVTPSGGCERLGVTLVHARPGDAPARGKMERF